MDSADASVEVEDVGKVIERVSRTRTLNPKWIDGMLEHDFHGGSEDSGQGRVHLRSGGRHWRGRQPDLERNRQALRLRRGNA
ncbi:hypothetical protein AKJ64_05145 [candidate division MSBL1 archaeon SCGC-AAA259E17]|uniref:CobN/magnesium chelatase domain-containing protein n=1 Tax=candidate division MSBL1 archaeon SCGC-AAA259E17 TaxID=1698263 RepID=A0A133U9P1_9EURY|nr:hypothetical protein AKJ64_05145 [candidate division MSBL1 archaeon SCGC-AAA259E17]